MPEVRRDAYEIPHLLAEDVLGLARLQGHTTALDRAWQLEHARRKAEGRLSEILGTRGLPWDRLARRAGIDGIGRAAHARLDPETAAFVAAYVDGVNTGLAEAETEEFEHLGIRPEPWQPWTPLSVFCAHHLTFATLPVKLWRHHVHRNLSPALAGLFNDEGLWTPGSNAWAVGGDRTASGLPIIAGDPHRTFEYPNVYQQVRLTCTDPGGGFDVAGFTFPGVPGVQHFAHAGSVAWGITNASADYQDVYLERLERRGTEVWAQGPSGWEQVPSHVETIAVAGAEPVSVEVVSTPRGPVVEGRVGGDAFALRAPSAVLSDLGFGCLLPLLRSRTADDVEAALAGWVEPVNNLVVADDRGVVRHRVVGRIPDRAERNRWRAVPAWEPETGWRGWLGDLPAREVPADGQVVTANDRMDESFDRVGVEFAPPGRADRITHLLDDRDGLTSHDMQEIQADVLAGQPAALYAALAGLTGLTGPAADLRAEIVAWDQRFEVESWTAAAYVDVRDELVTRLAGDPAFAPVAGHGFSATFASWCHLPTQLYLSLATLCSARGRESLIEAGVDLDGRLRSALGVVAERPRRTWGERHPFAPTHGLGWQAPDEPGLRGDNDCVHCAGSPAGVEQAVRGSVARYVWDLAGLATSGWVVPLGARGQGSGAFDQLALWRTVRLCPIGAAG